MRILSRLTETHGTIVVVVAHHQSINRFRGASVANLLQFTRWFPGCGMVEFTTKTRLQTQGHHRNHQAR